MKKIILLLALAITSCKAQEPPITFSEAALNDNFIDVEGSNVTMRSILKQYEGKKIVIDVWASWCRDCIKGMPKLEQLQAENEEAVYVFLSLDKYIASWKRGIDKHNIVGQHYFMSSGWKGDFATFLDLDWIPRYMVIDENQNITVFKATKADDDKIKLALK